MSETGSTYIHKHSHIHAHFQTCRQNQLPLSGVALLLQQITDHSAAVCRCGLWFHSVIGSDPARSKAGPVWAEWFAFSQWLLSADLSILQEAWQMPAYGVMVGSSYGGGCGASARIGRAAVQWLSCSLNVIVEADWSVLC